MMSEDFRDLEYNELRSIASEQDLDLGRNPSRDQLVTALRDANIDPQGASEQAGEKPENPLPQDAETDAGEEDQNSGSQVSETGENSRPDMTITPDRDAPAGETIFNHEDVETQEGDGGESQEQEDLNTPDLEDLKEGGQGDGSGDSQQQYEEVKELTTREVQGLHSFINNSLRFIGGWTGLFHVQQLGKEKLEEIAEDTQEFANELIPDEYLAETGTYALLGRFMMPHAGTIHDADFMDAEEKSSDTQDEEKSEKANSTEQEFIEDLE